MNFLEKIITEILHTETILFNENSICYSRIDIKYEVLCSKISKPTAWTKRKDNTGKPWKDKYWLLQYLLIVALSSTRCCQLVEWHTFSKCSRVTSQVNKQVWQEYENQLLYASRSGKIKYTKEQFSDVLSRWRQVYHII